MPSPPAATFEPEDRQQDAQCDERETVAIAPAPAQLRHVVKVHAVHAGNQCWRNTNNRYDRQYFEDLILFSVDKAENSIQEKLGLSGQMRLEIDQRDEVLLRSAQASHLLRQQPVSRHLQHESDDTLQPEHALATMGQLIACDSNRLEAFAQPLRDSFIVRLRRGLATKCARRDHRHIATQFLEPVGAEVDHALDERTERLGTADVLLLSNSRFDLD